ncbi:Na+/H+ antiporter NhaC [Marinobacter halodurans]|uniref:Na+/H+ antiporter NhaC n=1 Tax=Marinobacter halodurans TaxID=2528979 RepID=A0ABY1ZFL8_9GAMM|nr:Na+/H+ antiporter NhaC [Marinobacter halodurans]TBW49829.1 Na+/H+ antiporter NhaC [Marinobacter halodurans]
MLDETHPEAEAYPAPSFGLSLTVFVLCAFTIGFSVIKLGVDAHIPMIISATICALVGVFILKRPWREIEQGITGGITIALVPVVILMLVGLLVATWIASGTVPTMIYYGMQVLSPRYFLVASFLICSVVSVATGSSWTTAGTVGLALMGAGGVLGISAPMIAGAVISGAYFGDKMSPLSDTTNLAPAMAGSDLFDHIRAMTWTTIPACLIAGVVYTVMGLHFSGDLASVEDIAEMSGLLNAHFTLGLFTLIPPAFILFAAIRKYPAIPSLIIGILLAAVLAIAVQGVAPAKLIGIVHYGFKADTGVSAVDSLLSRGGLDPMMWTISLIICALCFGGILERCGFLGSILTTFSRILRKPSSLIGTTLASCVAGNVFLGDQFLGIIVPGRTFRPAFERLGLAPRMLSRTLEDSGTLTAALIPWTSGGAYMFGVLGVSAFSYAPYAVFNWLTPLLAFAMTMMGIGIFWKVKEGQVTRRKPAQSASVTAPSPEVS